MAALDDPSDDDIFEKANPSEEEDDDLEYEEEQISFVDCTCEHDRDDHNWSGCNIEGCNCEGHWEE